MSERWSLVESSVDLLREKMKSLDLFKSNTEARMSQLESKYAVLVNSSQKNQKENLNGFDSLLSQSHIFVNSLKKVDTNSMTNIKKLEQYLRQIISDHQSNFLVIEQRMVGMLSQKQKIIRNMSLQMENHAHSIRAIQEWIKVDHSKGNSLSIMEESMKERLEAIQRNSEMKMGVIEERIKYFEHVQESANNNRRKQLEEKQEMGEEIKAVRKDIRKKIEELQERIQEETKRKTQQIHHKLDELSSKTSNNHQSITQLLTRTSSLRQQFEGRLSTQIKNIKEYIQSQAKLASNQRETHSQQKQSMHQYRQSRTQKRQNNQSRQMRQQSKKYSRQNEYQSDVSFATPVSYDRNSRTEFQHKNRYQQPVPKPPSRKQMQLNQKKPLPPKKNLFTSQSPPEIQQIPRERSGGIRGLLQKSKEKQRQELNRRSDTLSRQKGLSKGLPPVREDPFAKKKKNEVKPSRQQEEEQEVVYEIDQQGYLMDEEGNYLIDQNGEMIRLSPQELQQYMNEDQNQE